MREIKESKMYRFIRIQVLLICFALMFSAMPAVTKPIAKPKAKPKKVEQPAIPAIPQADILAEYDGGMITKKDLESKISKLPAQAQGRFKTVEGQIQILDIMTVEDIFYRKARDMNLLKDSTVLEKIDASRKQVLVQEYYKRKITNQVNLTDNDKQAYYEQNLQDFYVQPYITVLYIQPADEASAKKAIIELNKGVPFETVSNKYSINTYAKGINGMIKNIRLNGYIPGVGNDDQLDAIIEKASVDTLHYLGPQQTSTGWSIIKVMEKIEGRQRPYNECITEVEQRLKPKKEAELLNQIIDKQKLAYKVVIDSVTLMKVNLREPQNNKDLEPVVVVSSTDASLAMTVKQLLDKFNKMSPQEQMMNIKGGGALNMVNQELTRSLMYLDASKDKSYDEYLANNEDYKQSERYYILQEAYKRLVVDVLTTTPEELRQYYDTHLDTYTTPAARKIQAVWCKDEKTAKTAYKKFVSAAKKNKSKAIADVVKKYSVKPQQEIIDNLYNNGVVTGIGPDQNLADLIWNTKVGSVSPITKTVKGDIIFFRVLEERPPVVTSYTEAEPRIQVQLKKEKERIQMESVKGQLFTQYNLKKYPEKLEIKLSADELFDMADSSARQRKYKDATIYYDQIIKFYPNGTDDYKASFMKAFLVTEEMGNKDQGLQLFKEFLRKFPTGELNESAQYMIDELEGKHTEFEELEMEAEED